MAVVYRHIRVDTNEIFYIGIGNSKNRAYSKRNRGKYWNDFIKNHKYKVEITHDNITWEEACVLEKYLISFFGRRDLGLGSLVNLTDGGDGTVNQNHEVIKKISNKLKGRKQSIETIEKRRKKLKGKKRTDEFKDYCRKKFIGQLNPMYGKNNTTRSNLNKLQVNENNPRARTIIQYDLQGNYIAEYTTAKAAQDFTGILRSGICSACKGYNKTSGGFIWKYKNINNESKN